MPRFDIRRDTPTADGPAALIAAHLAQMNAQTPAESVHAIGLSGLDQPDVIFLALRVDGIVGAIGAVKPIDLSDGEIKSMHVARDLRGQGAGRAILDALISAAQSAGLTRLSLETGSAPDFAPARALYEQAGFTYCAPFGDYAPDPLSVFMTRSI